MTRREAHEINDACCWWYFDQIGLSEVERPLPHWTLGELLEAARIVREEPALGVVGDDGVVRRRHVVHCDERVLRRIARLQERRCACGRPVPDDRLIFAIPTCHVCLPPPPSLPELPWPSPVNATQGGDAS